MAAPLALAIAACAPPPPAVSFAASAIPVPVQAPNATWADLSDVGEYLGSGGELTDAEWSDVLLERVFRFPANGVASEDIVVGGIDPGGLDGHFEVRLEPRHPGLATVTAGPHEPMCGTMSLFGRLERACQVLGRLPTGRHELVFDAEVERRADADFDPYFDRFEEPLFADVVWEGTVTVAIAVE